MSFKRRKSIDNGDYNVTGANTSVTARKAARRAKTNPLAPAPRQKATVKQLATHELQTSVSGVDDHIVKRIQKCLERANHPNTPELEAKAALFLSSRLMSQYNVTKADLLAKETDANHARYGGSSVVSIKSTKGDNHRVIHQGFVDTVTAAMNLFFNCKSYSTCSPIMINWTFYGIAENTVAAAVAFEMAHNKILEWVRSHKGISASFSYCHGVADGLLSMAHKERENEREEVRRKERELLELREREEELQRQREVKGQNVGAGGDNDDHEVKGDSISEAELEPDFKLDVTETLDPTADLDEEIQRILKREESPTCPPDSVNTECQQDIKAGDSPNQGMGNIAPDVRWASEMQLTWFRETAEQVAEKVLKAKNIKLSRRAGKNTAVNDFGAYFQGNEDSRKINVRQKLVE